MAGPIFGSAFLYTRRRKTVMSIVPGVICVIYVLPAVSVIINSFKQNTYVKTDTFSLPLGEQWAGVDNYVNGMTFGGYPFCPPR